MKRLALIFLILLFAPLVAWAAISRVQTKSSGVDAGTTLTVTFTNPTTAGNTLICHVSEYYSGVETFTISDNGPNTWVQDMDVNFGVGGMEMVTWHASNITANASPQITVNNTDAGHGYFMLSCAEYSGLANSGVTDATSTWQYFRDNGGNASSTYQSGNITTTNANDLLIGGGQQIDNNTAVGNPLSPWASILTNTTSFSSDVVQEQIVSSTGTYNAKGTWSDALAHNESGWIASYKAAPAAAAPTPSTTRLFLTAGRISITAGRLSIPGN